MNTLKYIGSVIGGAAVVASAVGLTVGLAPASAAPQASPGVIVGVTADSANPPNYVVKIQGKFPMSEGEAYERLRNLGSPVAIEYTLCADDPGENDQIITSPRFPGTPGPSGGSLAATPSGLGFIRFLSVPRNQLNEDNGTDEIYFRVRFLQQGVGELHANSEAVSGSF